MYFEVEESPNCSPSVSMRFKELGRARPIQQIRISDRPDGSQLCYVTGWCDDPTQPLCTAYVQKVEESGGGLAYLIYGGNWGIRLKPVGVEESWDLESPAQWGEPFLLLDSPQNIIFANAQSDEL